jgi:hypothetical protein
MRRRVTFDRAVKTATKAHIKPIDGGRETDFANGLARDMTTPTLYRSPTLE